MLTSPPYMACLDLTARRVLVVGSGPLAIEKIAALVDCGARVTVVTRDPDMRLEDWQSAGRIELRRKVYDELDLDDHLLVIAATTDREIGTRIFHDAEARSMLVNVVDMPDLCNFILPAVARRGPLAIAISTSGASPALAKRMRAEADAAFDDAYARLAMLLDDVRDWAKAELPDYEARRDFFDGIVNADNDPIELLRAGADDEVHSLIEDAKASAAG